MRRSFEISVALAVLVGVAAGLAAYTFLYAKGYSYLTNNPAACTNCHVMQGQYDAWMKSSHHSVATCNDCHTPHNLAGKYAVKANNGFWHSFYFTTGWYPDTIEITLDALVDLINDIKNAKAKGTTDAQLTAARDYQRKGQFMIDFVMSENSMGFHAPQEATRILGDAINLCRLGQLSLHGGPVPSHNPPNIQNVASAGSPKGF
jgi:cytochrome c nitrite reductase small subunit